MTPRIQLRAATADDVPALLAVYRDAVHTTGPLEYTAEQVSAWASFADDETTFQTRALAGTCVVATVNDEVAGFGTLEAGGVLGLLYVSGKHGRRGLGTRLVNALLAHARAIGMPEVRTAASVFSRPLFEKNGFTLVETERREYGGVRFTRWLMACTLRADQPQ